nr:hypothetical protein [Lachnospiraceae bacterium]
MAKDQATKERLQYRDQLNKAGDKYAAFRERQSTNGFYTKAQIKDQRRSYVENHVWLFDAYFKGYTTDSQYLRLVDLSDNAQRLVRAGAQIFPDSTVGKMFGGPNDVALRQFRAKGKEKDRPREIDLQARVLRAHEERQSGEELSEDRIYEKNAPQARKNDESAGLKDKQIKGIREVCAWMYQNTKKHQKFVENIAGRPLMERLLIFYIVEHKDAVQHNMSVADAQRAKRSYVPNRQNFENQLLFRKHWYKVTKNYNWDLVSDAANIASQMLHVMDKNNP